MPDEIETRDEVEETASPETEVEQVEQREDDYEGLKRILESKFDELAAMLDAIRARVDAVADTQAESAVRSGVIITDGTAAGELEEDVETDDTVERILEGDLSLEELMSRD